jgi:carbon monoxide dehydrogenase subunit G
MDMTGEYTIAAPRDEVWKALNDEDVLKICIPGCEEIARTSDTTLTAKVVQKIGPVKARFDSAIELVDIVAPERYTIQGEGQGGVAGFAKGAATVTLESAGEDTILRYTAHAQIGGKLARLGSRLIDATARKVANQFFDNFHRHLHPESAEEKSAS